ncbi:hypothetical protein GCM10023185_02010 [Hymenobacter saemangeumensis]|uniref:Hpt domain-containing protein n=1 Tax=Hymenobacter saemangeumensis TaxID=1084522 RepID=A0ABP8HXZ3_9BACT
MSFFSEMESGIQALFSAVGNGFGGDPAIGQQHAANWRQHLNNANSPALRAISQELEVLNSHIGHGNAAGMAVSMQLLGELTAKAAMGIHTFEGTGDKMRELSQKLIAAAGNLRQIAATQQPVHTH